MTWEQYGRLADDGDDMEMTQETENNIFHLKSKAAVLKIKYLVLLNCRVIYYKSRRIHVRVLKTPELLGPLIGPNITI